jgi:hypothetical protein
MSFAVKPQWMRHRKHGNYDVIVISDMVF